MNALLLYNEAGNINKNNMSVHKLVQMCLRGLSLCLLMICLYYTSESEDIAGSLTFLLCGVYGGYAVVTFGLLLEAGLMQKSDKCVEALFLLCAIILNTMCVVVALYQYYTATTFRRERMMNKGIISILLVVLFSVDLSVLCWWHIDDCIIVLFSTSTYRNIMNQDFDSHTEIFPSKIFFGRRQEEPNLSLSCSYCTHKTYQDYFLWFCVR